MTFGNCPTCKEYDDLDPKAFFAHKCKPRWECVIEEKPGVLPPDDEWHAIRANSAETAAELFADYDDSHGAEYSIIKKGERGNTIILTRDPDKPSKVLRWHVIGEAVPTYRARPAGDHGES